MKNLNRYIILPILLFVLIYVVGCGPTTTVPRGWLPSVSAAQYESYGGWVSVRYHTEDSGSKVHGELIAIDPSQIFILTGQGFTNISIDSITHIKLTTVQLSNDADVDRYRQMMYPVKPLYGFRAYARFPQGLPEAIDVQSVKPKKKTREITHLSRSIEGGARAVNSVKSSPPHYKPIVDGGMGLRLGILGTFISSIDINVILGGELGFSFGKGPLIVDLNSQFFSGTHQDSKFRSFSMTIGGRYHFMNKRNILPYLGGGLTWDYTRYDRVERELRSVCLRWHEEEKFFLFIPYTDRYCGLRGDEWQDILYTYEGIGLGAYGIIGIEFRHLHQDRFSLELEINNPFYELNSPAKQRSISLDIPFSLGISWLHQF